MTDWDASDMLQQELDELLGETEPTNVEMIQYAWTPPQISQSKITPSTVTLNAEDNRMFEKFETELAELSDRQRNLAARADDPLYKAIEDGVIDPTMIPDDAAKVIDNLGFQQEYSNPGFFRRTFFGETPQPIGQTPSFSIGDTWEDVLENEPILPESGVEMTDMSSAARELQEIIPESTIESATRSPAYMTQAESMIGSGITPIDVQQMQYLTNANDAAVNSMTRQIPIQKLPSMPNEVRNLSQTYVEQELNRESVPLNFEDDLDEFDAEAWAEKEFGDPFES